MQTEFVCEIIE